MQPSAQIILFPPAWREHHLSDAAFFASFYGYKLTALRNKPYLALTPLRPTENRTTVAGHYGDSDASRNAT